MTDIITTAAEQPTAQPTVEHLIGLLDEFFGRCVPECIPTGVVAQAARAVLTLLPGRPEWVIKAEGVREAKDSIVELIALSDPDAPFSVSIESVLGLIADRIEADR